MDQETHRSDSNVAVLPDLSGRLALVVGGGGFIGRHVVRTFEAAGAHVRVLDIAPAPSEAMAHEWIVGSIADPSLVASAVTGCDTVVFLANSSLPGSSQANLSVEVDAHVRVTIQAAEMCNALGVSHFLFASSGGTVYGIEPEADRGLSVDMPTRPRNAYGVSKLAIEHYLRLLGGLRAMRTLSLRISNPYGEGQRALRAQGFVAAAMQHAVAGTRMQIWGDGSVERDFLHIEDVARAFAFGAVTEEAPAVLNVGSGKTVSLNEMLARIETATGRKVDVEYAADRVIDVHRNMLEIQSTSDAIGWRPLVDLDVGLKRTARWWLEGAPL